MVLKGPELASHSPMTRTDVRERIEIVVSNPVIRPRYGNGIRDLWLDRNWRAF
jgi:hypothetical protein